MKYCTKRSTLGTTETDIVIRIAGNPIQVERKNASIAAIVPIPAAIGYALWFYILYTLQNLYSLFSIPLHILNTSTNRD